MKYFLILIKVNAPYPIEREFRVKASSAATAVARAMRDWRKEFKGRRISDFDIKVRGVHGIN